MKTLVCAYPWNNLGLLKSNQDEGRQSPLATG